MAEAFYSIVLDHPAADVWSVIRPFGHYAWAGVTGTTTIEDGMATDQVGAVRRVELPGRTIRQVLLAHSDIERFTPMPSSDRRRRRFATMSRRSG